MEQEQQALSNVFSEKVAALQRVVIILKSETPEGWKFSRSQENALF